MKNNKYMMFFRSKDGSADISSKVMLEISKNSILRNEIDIEFINLDKRNINKLLSKMKNNEIDTPNVFYIFFDEENTINLIENTFENGVLIKTYSIADGNIIDRFKEDIINKYGTKKYWKIQSNDIVYKDFNIFELDQLRYSSWKEFKSEEDCLEKLRVYIENELENVKKTIENLNKKEKDLNKKLKKINKDLKIKEA